MKNRIDRVNKLIKEKIADILFKEIFVKDALITVQNVDTSKDLKYAKIKISVIPFKRSEDILKILKKQSPILQKKLGEFVKIKFLPHIIFQIDKSEEKAGRIEEILKNISKS